MGGQSSGFNSGINFSERPVYFRSRVARAGIPPESQSQQRHSP